MEIQGTHSSVQKESNKYGETTKVPLLHSRVFRLKRPFVDKRQGADTEKQAPDASKGFTPRYLGPRETGSVVVTICVFDDNALLVLSSDCRKTEIISSRVRQTKFHSSEFNTVAKPPIASRRPNSQTPTHHPRHKSATSALTAARVEPSLTSTLCRSETIFVNNFCSNN